MLRRIGSKAKLLPDLIALFPDDITVFVDLFCGTCSVSIEMAKKCSYVFANDIDEEVFNLFEVARNKNDELYKAFEFMPYHQALFNYWKKHHETDPIWRAVRFLMLSNCGFIGKSDTLCIATAHSKERTLENIKNFFLSTKNIQFMCKDFRRALKAFNIMSHTNNDVFIYADPPYLNTGNNYNKKNSFTEKDFDDLLTVLIDSGYKFAISEFDREIIINKARKDDLFVYSFGERRTLKKRQTEILITNYQKKKKDERQLLLCE